ncbi:hypothetical protein [Cryobacterium sp. W22_MBD10_FK3]|uniref:hypothetical protein n=1 Tax=Cryobacterium sp. W22_MBD10_FK3 TaxID=3240273 RepID=UPI003F919848
MTDTAFKLGDDVFTSRARGTIIDVRATPSGNWVFGVEDVTGEVSYFTGKALRLAQSNHIPSPHETSVPELEVDQTIAPRPEEDIADVLRAKPDVEDHSEHRVKTPPAPGAN